MDIRRVVPNLKASAPLERSRQFYEGVIGLELEMDLGWIISFRSRSNPTAQLAVLLNDATAPVHPDVSVEVEDVDGGDIVVNSAQGRLKDRNLAADPRMSVMIADGYRFVRVDGRARIDHDQATAHADIRRLAARYYGDEKKADDAMRDNFSKQHR